MGIGHGKSRIRTEGSKHLVFFKLVYLQEQPAVLKHYQVQPTINRENVLVEQATNQ